jgi:hypothetical protein
VRALRIDAPVSKTFCAFISRPAVHGWRQCWRAKYLIARKDNAYLSAFTWNDGRSLFSTAEPKAEGLTMIAPETGMKPGERYRIESVERAPQFPGFFLDGKYYLGPELQTAVGWLEGQNFLYDQLDPNGEPVYPDRIVGTITARTLELTDGLRLSIEEVPFQAEALTPFQTLDEVTLETRPRAISQRHTAAGLRKPIQPSPLLVAGAALLVGLCLLAINRSGGRVK